MATLLFSLLLLSAGGAAARAPLNADRSPQAESLLSFSTVESAVGWLRLNALVPVLRVTISLCLIILAMQIAEKAFVGIVSFYVRLFRRSPEKVYKWKPIVNKDSSAFPMVLVQIPMYNEKEVSPPVSAPFSLQIFKIIFHRGLGLQAVHRSCLPAVVAAGQVHHPSSRRLNRSRHQGQFENLRKARIRKELRAELAGVSYGGVPGVGS